MPRTGRPGLSLQQKKSYGIDGRTASRLVRLVEPLVSMRDSIHGVLSVNGGIAPRIRKARAGSLTFAEREEISRGLATNSSLRSIAKQLGRAPSTISREIARNGNSKNYRATSADICASNNALRPKACALQANDKLVMVVAERLKSDWSPQQISGWLSRAYRDDKTMQISH